MRTTSPGAVAARVAVAQWSWLPAALSRVSHALGALAADGLYLCAWPRLAASAPALALGSGALWGWAHDGATFTFSIVPLALAFAVGSLGAALGAWVSLGYALTDSLLVDHLRGTGIGQLVYVHVPLLISYALLALLLIVVPLATKALRVELVPTRHGSRRTRMAIAIVAHVAIQAALVLGWTQATPTLVRPVYTWRGDWPPVEAFRPLQSDGWILVLLAGLLGAVRVVLEYRASARPELARLVLQLRAALSRPVPPWLHVPPWARIVARSLVAGALLSGLVTAWWEALLMMAGVAATAALNAALSRVGPWARAMRHVPLALRLATGTGASWLVASHLLGRMWGGTESFLPIVLSVVVSQLVFALLLPRPAELPRPSPAGGDQP